MFVKAILGVFLSFPSDHLFSLFSTNNFEEMLLFSQKAIKHAKLFWKFPSDHIFSPFSTKDVDEMRFFAEKVIKHDTL